MASLPPQPSGAWAPGAPRLARPASLGEPWRWSVVVLAVIVASFAVTLTSGNPVNAAGFSLLGRFVSAALKPALDAQTLELIVKSSGVTLTIATCGTAVSVLIGTFAGLWASETWWALLGFDTQGTRVWRRPVFWVRAFLAVPRGVPEIVWGLFLINVLGLDCWVAVLAIGIPFGAITAKVFSEHIDETPRRAAVAYRAAGAGAINAFFYGIWPTVSPSLVAYACYRFECAIRSAAVLGLIGASGLGYQIMLSLDTLRYAEVWSFLYALIVIVAASDWLSSRVTGILQKQIAPTAEELRKQTRTMTMVLAGAAIASVAAYSALELELARLCEPRRILMLRDVLVASWPPKVRLDELPGIVGLATQTVAMSIAAITIASCLAIGTSWIATPRLWIAHRTAARSWEWLAARVTAAAVRLGLVAVRSLSDGIWVLLALFVFYPGPFAGAVALGVYNFGVMGRLLVQLNEVADTKPYSALRAQGAGALGGIAYGFLPTLLPQYLAYALYRWEVCVRATMVVGIVAAGGLGRRLQDQMVSFDYRGVAATLIGYIVLTVVVDTISGEARRALRAS